MIGESVEKLADAHPIISSEYQRAGESGVIEDLWFDYDSDFDHGADWKVLPVYLSKELFRKLYGDQSSYRLAMDLVCPIWSDTWDAVFDSLDKKRVSLVAFSKLGPQQVLKEHQHDNDGHIIFHMGIEIPEGDEGAVGLNTSFGEHLWRKPGDWVLFDDTKTHSAWNRTDQDRVVFYVDFVP